METHAQRSLNPTAISPDELQLLQRIITEVRRHTDLDFSHYKSATLLRRVQRRILFHHLSGLDAYWQLLARDPAEGHAVAHDLFIPVTQFFRDPSVFETLSRDIIPQLIQQTSPSDPLRIWIAGCSTGEEVYSFAISLYEGLQEQNRSTSTLHLIGTDANAQAIEYARRGIYTPDKIVGLSAQRVQRFFRPLQEKYQIIPEIRDCCLFAQHHLYQDPPFGRMRLISCRNVLIYLQAPMQQHLFHLFHYALQPGGFLVLGKMENLGASAEFFTPLSLREKLYQKQNAVVVPTVFSSPLTGRGTGRIQQKERAVFMDSIHDEAVIQQEADQILLARYAPASVLVTQTLEIVHVRGHTGAYLEPAPGKASLNLLKMVREELALNLRRTLRQAAEERQTVVAEESFLSIDGQTCRVTIEVIPLRHEQPQPFYLVLFSHTPLPNAPSSLMPSSSPTGTVQEDAKDQHIATLERDLQVMREEMRVLIENQTAYREELQTANEELLASNEELQTVNEELETSKEALQTTNGTLQQLNLNLLQQQRQVTIAQQYADAIIATVRDPLLVLDSDERVLRVNASFSRYFHISKTATEGQLLSELGNGQWDIPALQQLLDRVLSHNEMFEDFRVEHVFPAIGHRILLLNARRIAATEDRQALILLAIEDVTERERIEQELAASEERMRLWIEQASDVLTVLSASGAILHQSASVQRVLGWSVEECQGTNLLEGDWIHPQDHPQITTFLQSLHEHPTEVATTVVRMQQKEGSWCSMELRGRNLLEHPLIHGLVILSSDVTERRAVEQQKERFFGVVSHELRTPITAMKANIQLIERRLARLLTQSEALSAPEQQVVQEVMLLAQRAGRQVNLQNRIIQDLIDISRIQSKKLDLRIQEYRLEVIVRETVEDLRASAPQRVIEEEEPIDLPLWIQADAQRIGQVLTNYITNALKYSPETEPIRVGIEKDDNIVRVWVRDQGPGLSTKQQQRIWDSFYQVPGRPERGGFGLGLGLGLHICDQIIKAHGGSLGVESQQGKGATFWFALPLDEQHLLPAQKSQPANTRENVDDALLQ